MVEYPYGRSGQPVVHYESEVRKAELEKSGTIGDNQVRFGDEFVYLYEAPNSDDPGRGHFSKWKKEDGDRYIQVSAISGDDGMCYQRFTSEIDE